MKKNENGVAVLVVLILNIFYHGELLVAVFGFEMAAQIILAAVCRASTAAALDKIVNVL